jgi:hypothetical protein
VDIPHGTLEKWSTILGPATDNGLELDREAALWYYNLGFRAKGFPALDGSKVLC